MSQNTENQIRTLFSGSNLNEFADFIKGVASADKAFRCLMSRWQVCEDSKHYGNYYLISPTQLRSIEKIDSECGELIKNHIASLRQVQGLFILRYGAVITFTHTLGL